MERDQSDLNELADLVASQFDELSPQLRKAARFLLESPDDVALRSMRQLAAQSGIPPATFVRLARALGYKEYQELRLLFQGRMRKRSADVTGYTPKVRDLQLRTKTGGTAELLNDLYLADIRNIESTFENNNADVIERALKLIEKSGQVYIVGQRSCYSVAFFFNYVYRLAHSNSTLLHSDGGIFADELRDIKRADLLIAISLAPYSKSVVEATHFARERGAKVLAITDDRLSAIGRAATECLTVSSGTPSFFHSLISLVAIVEALLACLAARGGKEALAAIKQSERQTARFNPYWPDKPKKSER